jgi:hypothetical protein
MSAAAELPEPDGDLEWQKIVNDPRPRPALTTLGDEIAEQFKTILAVGRDRQYRRPEPISSARSARQRKGAGEDGEGMGSF